MGEVFKARQGFSVVLEGRQRVVRRGEEFLAGDPLLAAHGDQFEEASEVVERRRRRVRDVMGGARVESATAAPGERRSLVEDPPRRRRPAVKGAEVPDAPVVNDDEQED